MNYYELRFTYQSPIETEILNDVLAAELGEIGFESFTQDEQGLQGYISDQLYDEAVLKETLAAFPLEETTIHYVCTPVESKDWNEEWEKNYFKPIRIGNDCLIYQGVTLGGVSLDKGKRHPTLEDGVVVGAGAKILGNITIGKGSKIGANSVVVKDVPPNSTAVGIPAKCVSSNNRPFEHNKLPDITKELLIYLIEKVENLECQNSTQLDKKYQEYIKSIKE